MVKAHPDGTIVVESTGNLCDFFLLRPKELSAEEALELAKRKELAKYGQKRRPSDAPAEDKVTIESIDAKPLYRTHRAAPPDVVEGPSLVIVTHGDETRLKVGHT